MNRLEQIAQDSIQQAAVMNLPPHKRGRHDAVVFTLKAYASTPYGERWGNRFTKEQKRQNAIDLLANLRHFCDVEGLDFAELDRQAYRHYSAENR